MPKGKIEGVMTFQDGRHAHISEESSESHEEHGKSVAQRIADAYTFARGEGQQPMSIVLEDTDPDGKMTVTVVGIMREVQW